MCGIFGILPIDNSIPNSELLKRATQMLQHRGPDGAGYHTEKNFAFGHRRLSIIDISRKGKQPMCRFEKIITYNGEIYNYLELRKNLEKKGYSFVSQTDTEVILAAYTHWGQDCIHHFNGMWAFAIYDSQKKEIFCSRDRLGIKPFYYTSIQNTFYFSSEIKAFSVVPGWNPVFNENYTTDFLLLGKQHQGAETNFNDVLQLLPGHNLIFDLETKKIHIKRYYNIDNIVQQKISSKEAVEEFRRLFYDSIRIHLRADVKVGTAFSGGLDSSAILTYLYKNIGGQNLEAVTYCNGVKGLDESEFVDAFAKKYPIRIHRISPDFESLSQALEKVTLAQDEPVISGSLLAQYFVFKEAKGRGLKVMLDGQGADELLAGYGTYYPPFFRYLFKNYPLKLIPEILGLLWYHQIPFGKIFQNSHKNIPCTGINLTQFQHNKKRKSGFRDYTKNMIKSDHLPALLHYEDRNSMAHGVEARLPFLDHQLVEFLLSLSPEKLIKNGVRKKIMRDALGSLLPLKILNRYDKLGFTTPQEIWMETYTNTVLKLAKEAQTTFPEIFNKQWMEWVSTILRKKQRRHYPLIWRAISLGKWGKLYLSRK